jgi:CHC2 zinc finger
MRWFFFHAPRDCKARFAQATESQSRGGRIMSRRHFDRTENHELRAKIDEAKRRLPLPDLMTNHLGLGKHAKKEAHCPFHKDEHPSFSVFQGKNGKGWQWKCHAGCGYGDEIVFLLKHFGI